MSLRLLNCLKEERERLDLTQGELAQQVGVSRKTINTIENLVFAPSALLAIKLAQHLGRKVEDIFWIDGGPPRNGAIPQQTDKL
jgi:putative transcriptional regulator